MNVSLGHTTVGLDRPVSILWDRSAASGTRAAALATSSQMTVVAKVCPVHRNQHLPGLG